MKKYAIIELTGEIMEKIIEIDDKKYKLIKDYREGYDEEMFKEKYTSFFDASNSIGATTVSSSPPIKSSNKSFFLLP